MGAGDRSGPKHHRQARQGGFEECNDIELRHEHAAHEQRIRHGNVA